MPLGEIHNFNSEVIGMKESMLITGKITNLGLFRKNKFNKKEPSLVVCRANYFPIFDVSKYMPANMCVAQVFNDK